MRNLNLYKIFGNFKRGHLNFPVFSILVLMISNSHAGGLRCESIFVKSQKINSLVLEHNYLDKGLKFYLKTFLGEGQDRNNNDYFFVDHQFGDIFYFYTNGNGHKIINRIARSKDFLSPDILKLGKLETPINLGRHLELRTFSGGKHPIQILERLKEGMIYSPGYFFSTSKKLEIAELFIPKKIPANTHVKILFEVEGRSGLDIADESFFSESEVLYPPFTRFRVVKVEPEFVPQGKESIFHILLKEIISDPIKIDSSRYLDLKSSEEGFLQDDLEQRFVPKNEKDSRRNSKAENARLRKAQEFVFAEARKGRQLTVDLLKEIHQLLIGNEASEIYKRKIVKNLFFSKKIDEEIGIKILLSENPTDIYPEYDQLLNQYSEKTAGTFRNKEEDNISINGLHIDPNGSLYFSVDELFKLSMNPYLRVIGGPQASKIIQKNSKKIVPDGDLPIKDATVYLLPYQRIESAVKNLILQTQKNLKSSKSDFEYVMAVLHLQKSLMSIQPFYERNQECIQLLSDFLFLQRGIAPPLEPVSKSFAMSLQDLYYQTIERMHSYVLKNSNGVGLNK